MPLEVTPVPFAGQQLPYTPKFMRPELEGMPGSGVGGMAMGGGPATAAASAIIPPSPGGIAGPHRAIPALPEVGYTAPSVAPSSFGGGDGGGGEYPYAPSSYGGPLPPGGVGINGARIIQSHPHPAPSTYGSGSVYGGASQYGSATLYGAPRHPLPGQALSAIQSDYSFANSLPAPRRGPAPSLLMGENVIAPKSNHHHHHHHSHSHSHSARSYVDDDDKASDVSYYARPKIGRTRSGSIASSISDTSTLSPSARDRDGGYRHHHHKRSHSNDHHHHHPGQSQHLYQERRASPRLQPVSNQHEHSPSSPSPLSLAAPPVPGPLSPRRGEPVRQKSYGHEREREREKEDGRRDRKVSSLAQSEQGGHGGRSGEDGDDGDLERRRGGLETPHEHHRDSQKEGHHHQGHRHKSNTHSHAQDDHDHHHHETRRRRHTTHHRHHSHSHPHTPIQQAPSIPPASIAHSARRRALSMQFDPRPIEDAQGMYQAPQSVLAGQGGYGPGQGYMQGNMYDDGASVAGSAMTFMDGPVGGRVSQYGLPKYSHQPKPDYRRFMVQRGNADVFLD